MDKTISKRGQARSVREPSGGTRGYASGRQEVGLLWGTKT
jgi:hypothetical protein